MILALQSNLRDNFDRHVFNYSVFKLLESMVLQSGDLDYVLPLILPMTIDEIYGRSGGEKDQVDKG